MYNHLSNPMILLLFWDVRRGQFARSWYYQCMGSSALGVINMPLAEVLARFGAETREDIRAANLAGCCTLNQFAREIDPAALSVEFRAAAIVALETDGCLYGPDEADERAVAARLVWTGAVPRRVLRQRCNRAAWLAILAASLHAAADRDRARREAAIADGCDTAMTNEQIADAVEYGAMSDLDAEAEAVDSHARECAERSAAKDDSNSRLSLAIVVLFLAVHLSDACSMRITQVADTLHSLISRLHRLPHLALSPRMLARPRDRRALTAAA